VAHHNGDEAMWESWAHFDMGRRQFDIAMAGWEMEDRDMQQWCAWFRARVERIGTRLFCEQRLTAREVNFSNNQLTGLGVRMLLNTLLDTQVVVRVLKLHHNRLEEGGSVADYLRKCDGTLWELHLSHNRLGTAAVLDILVGAAQARDESGAPSYPYQAGCRGPTPLWLRIERNFVHCDMLLERVEVAARRLGRVGQMVCLSNCRGCTPHGCGRHRDYPPATHAKNLTWQRQQDWLPHDGGDDFEEEADCGEEGELSSVYSGIKAFPAASSSTSDTRLSPGSHDNDENLDQWSKSEADIDETGHADPLQVDVLRWSEETFSWVRDVIEIAPMPSPRTPAAPSTDSGRKSLEKKTNNGGESNEVMAQNLRTMIGINGAQARRPSAQSSSATTPVSSESVAAIVRHLHTLFRGAECRGADGSVGGGGHHPSQADHPRARGRARKARSPRRRWMP